MKGYKAFDINLKCLDMQYEIGKEYTFDGKPIPCQQGFHFCKSIADCYNFYDMSYHTRICEITAKGDITTDDEIKYCTNKIKIVREVKNPRVKSNLSYTNSGYCNSGDQNSGDQNSGNWNTGDQNSGNWNSGDCNTGDSNSGNQNSGNRNSGNWNSGDWNPGNWNSGYMNLGDQNSGDQNSGNWNTGDQNSGNWNSGYRNSGNRNSGAFNSGNWNSGVFNTARNPKINIFDTESEWTMNDWLNSEACTVMLDCPCTHSEFIDSSAMTVEEKENHPEFKTIGGYVKTIVVTDKDKQEWWDSLSSDKRQAVYNLPNFEAEKFRVCTGIIVKVESEDIND